MSSTVRRVTTATPARNASELSLADAAKRAEKGEAFAVSAGTAKKLVGLIPADLMGLPSDEVEKGRDGWEGKRGTTALVEVKFPDPIEHPDGPFARAFLDAKNDRVWFMTTDEAARVDAKANPPADLLGTVQLSGTVVGGVSMKRVASTLKLEAAPAVETPEPKRGSRADGFKPVEGGSKKLTQKELAQKTREYLHANMGENRLLPPIDGGNLGSSALLLSDAPATELLGHMKENLLGVPEVQQFEFEPARQQMFAVIDSEDEIHLHVGVIDQHTGEITYLSDFNTVDLPEIPNADDSTIAYLDEFTKDGKWLSLGTGDAGPNWWR